ncbi:MAG: tRNA lysidine(34) synthetase TilS [Thermodesulfobacteriaceae bacterium]
MLLRRIKRFIEENNLFQPGDRVLVAVSAGLDSVALLDILLELRDHFNLKLFVSHYDHRIRKNSLDDALFVYRLCKEKRLPLFITSAPVPMYAKRERLSLEMAGRELRYRAWYELAKSYDFQKIALAHHLDDLTEEIFMKIIRGTGRRGLAGIPLKREDLIVRPLLFLTKEEIKKYAQEKGLTWRDDPTNEDLRFLRNKVRHVLIPFLAKEFNPKIKEAVRKTAVIIAEEEELIEGLAREAFYRVKTTIDGDLALKLTELKKLPPVIRRRLYFLAFHEMGLPLFRITSRHIFQIETLLTGKAIGPVCLPGKYCVYRGPGYIRISQRLSTVEPFELAISSPGIYDLPFKNLGKVLVEKISRESLPDSAFLQRAILLDANKVAFPIILRNRRPGDRIHIPGLGHKKLKKFLWEKRVPVYKRDSLLIVEKDGEILAVYGLYIHPMFRPTETTEDVLLIRLENSNA